MRATATEAIKVLYVAGEIKNNSQQTFYREPTYDADNVAEQNC